VDRDLLVQLLSGEDGEDEAFTACRQFVVAGARLWVSDQVQPAAELARTYQRRARHTEQVGIPTLGFPAAVRALRRYGEQLVRLGAVDVSDPPYHFQLFLDKELTSVIACLGVDQDPAHRREPPD
jgi:hypothetical protein